MKKFHFDCSSITVARIATTSEVEMYEGPWPGRRPLLKGAAAALATTGITETARADAESPAPYLAGRGIADVTGEGVCRLPLGAGGLRCGLPLRRSRFRGGVDFRTSHVAMSVMTVLPEFTGDDPHRDGTYLEVQRHADSR